MERRNLRVLIADDYAGADNEGGTSAIIKTVMYEELGFSESNIDVVHDGNAAWARLQTGQYDLFLTDNDMPGMTGIAVIQAARAHPALKDQKIILMSNLHVPKCGANEFMPKPPTLASLEKAINKVIPMDAEAETALEEAPHPFPAR